MTRGLARLLSRLRGDMRGNTALIFALAVPFLGMMTAGGVELAFLAADKAKMQGVADATALAGAKELTLAMQAGAPDRAKAMVMAELAEMAKRSDISVDAQVVQDGGGLQVQIFSHRQSFFGSLLPPGGFNTHVTAIGVRMGRVPLCVLSSQTDATSGINMSDSSIINASNCLVHSNSTITVNDSAFMQAASVQSGGEAKGRISPDAQVGAAAIDDPFASMNISPPAGCSIVTDVLLDLGISIAPGVHCGNFIVHKGQILRLAPGIHYFKGGDIKLKQDAQLIGSDVTLVFDNKSSLSATDSSVISLEGSKSGPFAGFVLVTTHDAQTTFEISTDSAHKLLGTIYIPNATLSISGSGTKVADQSPWTVVVAKTIEITGTPSLVINANYAGSTTPVPEGVGDTVGSVRLAQ